MILFLMISLDLLDVTVESLPFEFITQIPSSFSTGLDQFPVTRILTL